MAATLEQILTKKKADLLANMQAGDRGTLASNYGTYNGEKRYASNLKKDLEDAQGIASSN